MGLHCCQTIMSCYVVPICPCIETRLAWRVLLTSVDASLMLVVMALSWRRGGSLIGRRILALVWGCKSKYAERGEL